MTRLAAIATEDKPMSEPMDPNMRVWGYTASELRRAINIAANYEPGWYAGVRFILPDIDPEDAALIVAAVNALPSLLDERELLRAALVEADRFLSLYWDDGGDAGDEEQLALAQGVIRDALAMVLRWQATVPEPVREFRFHPKRKWRFDFAWPRDWWQSKWRAARSLAVVTREAVVSRRTPKSTPRRRSSAGAFCASRPRWSTTAGRWI